MITGDLPAMASASHQHTIYGLNNMVTPLATVEGGFPSVPRWFGDNVTFGQQTLFAPGAATPVLAVAPAVIPKKAKEKPVTRRLVQVFIADPDENVPLEQSMLYSGDQKLTDATDQELFFEIDMKSILEAHNKKRVAVINKKVKDRTEFLEPAKIRDLKMVVVNVATF